MCSSYFQIFVQRETDSFLGCLFTEHISQKIEHMTCHECFNVKAGIKSTSFFYFQFRIIEIWILYVKWNSQKGLFLIFMQKSNITHFMSNFTHLEFLWKSHPIFIAKCLLLLNVNAKYLLYARFYKVVHNMIYWQMKRKNFVFFQFFVFF